MGLLQFTKNFSYVMIAQVCTTALATGAMIFLIRYLGPERLGIYSYVVTIMGIIGILSDCGLGISSVKKISQDVENAHIHFSHHFSAQIIIVFIDVIIISLLVWQSQPHVATLIMISSIGLLFSNFYIPFASLLNGLQDFKYVPIISLTAGLLNLTLIVIGIKYSLSLTFFMFTTVIPGMTSCIVSFIYARKYIVSFFVSREDIIKTFASGLPYFILLSCGIIYGQIDVLMLKYFSTDNNVGLYAAAYKIIFFLVIVPKTLSAVLYPMLANFYKEREDKVRFILNSLSKYMIITGFMISFYFFFFAGNICELLYGDSFMDSVACVQLLIWSFFSYCTYTCISSYWLAIGKGKRMNYIYFTSIIINVLLNYFLIPGYAIVGAALSTVISEVFIIIIYYTILLREDSDFLKETRLMHMVVIAVISIIGTWLIDNLYFTISFILYYSLLLYLFKVVKREEIALIKVIFEHFYEKVKPFIASNNNNIQ